MENRRIEEMPLLEDISFYNPFYLYVTRTAIQSKEKSRAVFDATSIIRIRKFVFDSWDVVQA